VLAADISATAEELAAGHRHRLSSPYDREPVTGLNVMDSSELSFWPSRVTGLERSLLKANNKIQTVEDG
jgi:hypothetical protein